MAVDDRHSQPDLKAIQADAKSMDFFELLRQLETRDRRFGQGGGAARDPARLGQPIRMSFATSDVVEVVPGQGDAPPNVSVNVVGLFGPEGPMPLHLTKWMLDRASNRWFAGSDANATSDTAFLDFGNALQHRMIAFYWRAWADMRPDVQYSHGTGGSVGAMVRALAGVGLNSSDPSANENAGAKLRHATSLFQRVHNPRRLVEYLTSELGQPVELIEFVGVWNDIPQHLQSRLGRAGVRLGRDTVIGARFFERQSRAEIRIGPLSFDEYLAFFDDPERSQTLRQALRFVASKGMSFDVRLVLRGDEVPPPTMGKVRLGQVAWLDTGTATDRCEMVFRDFTNTSEGLAA